MLLAFCLTVIYIVLLIFLDRYNYYFGMIHGTSQGITDLLFLGVVVGLFGASALVSLVYKWVGHDLKTVPGGG